MRTLRQLSIAGVLVVCTAVLSCSTPRVRETVPPMPSIPFKPPHAVAPPDVGVDPPPVRLLDPHSRYLPLEERPQRQLTGWALSLSEGLNIPRAALEAYGYAEQALRVSQPGCGVSWPVLAGIGEVESDHGRFGQSRLDPNGRTTIPIRGVPLRGDNGTKRMEDPGQTNPDGSPVFVQAMGPFQFLPKTWRSWGQDADGDKIADPDNIYDTALAAGTYLCAIAGGDMRQADRFHAAVFTYNESQAYVQEVLDYADYYGRQSRVLLARQPAPTASPLQSGR